MSLGLKDLKKTKKPPAANPVAFKTKVLRPWESYDHLGDQVRTIRAKEALVAAQTKKAALPPLPILADEVPVLEAISPGEFPEPVKSSLPTKEKASGLFRLFLHFLCM